ncbi:MAG: hypothetical protein JW937_00275 [Candidatus Omnitrophica bacterium]|nr:hypothetical protein [Candidatus Omnitrophota bacterium]
MSFRNDKLAHARGDLAGFVAGMLDKPEGAPDRVRETLIRVAMQAWRQEDSLRDWATIQGLAQDPRLPAELRSYYALQWIMAPAQPQETRELAMADMERAHERILQAGKKLGFEDVQAFLRGFAGFDLERSPDMFFVGGLVLEALQGGTNLPEETLEATKDAFGVLARTDLGMGAARRRLRETAVLLAVQAWQKDKTGFPAQPETVEDLWHWLSPMMGLGFDLWESENRLYLVFLGRDHTPKDYFVVEDGRSRQCTDEEKALYTAYRQEEEMRLYALACGTRSPDSAVRRPEEFLAYSSAQKRKLALDPQFPAPVRNYFAMLEVFQGENKHGESEIVVVERALVRAAKITNWKGRASILRGRAARLKRYKHAYKVAEAMEILRREQSDVLAAMGGGGGFYGMGATLDLRPFVEAGVVPVKALNNLEGYLLDQGIISEAELQQSRERDRGDDQQLFLETKLGEEMLRLGEILEMVYQDFIYTITVQLHDAQYLGGQIAGMTAGELVGALKSKEIDFRTVDWSPRIQALLARLDITRDSPTHRLTWALLDQGPEAMRAAMGQYVVGSVTVSDDGGSTGKLARALAWWFGERMKRGDREHAKVGVARRVVRSLESKRSNGLQVSFQEHLMRDLRIVREEGVAPWVDGENPPFPLDEDPLLALWISDSLESARAVDEGIMELARDFPEELPGLLGTPHSNRNLLGVGMSLFMGYYTTEQLRENLELIACGQKTRQQVRMELMGAREDGEAAYGVDAPGIHPAQATLARLVRKVAMNTAHEVDILNAAEGGALVTALTDKLSAASAERLRVWLKERGLPEDTYVEVRGPNGHPVINMGILVGENIWEMISRDALEQDPVLKLENAAGEPVRVGPSMVIEAGLDLRPDSNLLHQLRRPRGNPEVIEAIERAQMDIWVPGSINTSILANLNRESAEAHFAKAAAAKEFDPSGLESRPAVTIENLVHSKESGVLSVTERLARKVAGAALARGTRTAGVEELFNVVIVNRTFAREVDAFFAQDSGRWSGEYASPTEDSGEAAEWVDLYGDAADGERKGHVFRVNPHIRFLRELAMVKKDPYQARVRIEASRLEALRKFLAEHPHCFEEWDLEPGGREWRVLLLGYQPDKGQMGLVYITDEEKRDLEARGVRVIEECLATPILRELSSAGETQRRWVCGNGFVGTTKALYEARHPEVTLAKERQTLLQGHVNLRNQEELRRLAPNSMRILEQAVAHFSDRNVQIHTGEYEQTLAVYDADTNQVYLYVNPAQPFYEQGGLVQQLEQVLQDPQPVADFSERLPVFLQTGQDLPNARAQALGRFLLYPSVSSRITPEVLKSLPGHQQANMETLASHRPSQGIFSDLDETLSRTNDPLSDWILEAMRAWVLEARDAHSLRNEKRRLTVVTNQAWNRAHTRGLGRVPATLSPYYAVEASAGVHSDPRYLRRKQAIQLIKEVWEEFQDRYLGKILLRNGNPLELEEGVSLHIDYRDGDKNTGEIVAFDLELEYLPPEAEATARQHFDHLRDELAGALQAKLSAAMGEKEFDGRPVIRTGRGSVSWLGIKRDGMSIHERELEMDPKDRLVIDDTTNANVATAVQDVQQRGGNVVSYDRHNPDLGDRVLQMVGEDESPFRETDDPDYGPRLTHMILWQEAAKLRALRRLGGDWESVLRFLEEQVGATGNSLPEVLLIDLWKTRRARVTQNEIDAAELGNRVQLEDGAELEVELLNGEELGQALVRIFTPAESAAGQGLVRIRGKVFLESGVRVAGHGVALENVILLDNVRVEDGVQLANRFVYGVEVLSGAVQQALAELELPALPGLVSESALGSLELIQSSI